MGNMVTHIATTEKVMIGPAPRIAAEHMGSGEAVIFLHGIGGNRSNWSEQLPAFAERGYHAIAWDARGWGDSDDYDGLLDFNDFSRDLVRLMDHFDLRSAHFVGLSMGGFILQDFYHFHPEKVKTMTLADTSVSMLQEFGEEWIEEFVSARKKPLLEGKEPKDIAPGVAKALVGPDASSETVRRLADSLAALRKGNYIKAIDTVTRHLNPLDHRQVKVPALVIVGSADALTSPDGARHLASLIPGAEMAVIEGAGHLSNMEKPEEFNRIVLDFLARH